MPDYRKTIVVFTEIHPNRSRSTKKTFRPLRPQRSLHDTKQLLKTPLNPHFSVNGKRLAKVLDHPALRALKPDAGRHGVDRRSSIWGGEIPSSFTAIDVIAAAENTTI